MEMGLGINFGKYILKEKKMGEKKKRIKNARMKDGDKWQKVEMNRTIIIVNDRKIF